MFKIHPSVPEQSWRMIPRWPPLASSRFGPSTAAPRPNGRKAGFTALIGKCLSHEVDLTPLRATVPFSAGGVSERHSGLGGIERRALRFDGDSAKLLVRPTPDARRRERWAPCLRTKCATLHVRGINAGLLPSSSPSPPLLKATYARTETIPGSCDSLECSYSTADWLW